MGRELDLSGCNEKRHHMARAACIADVERRSSLPRQDSSDTTSTRRRNAFDGFVDDSIRFVRKGRAASFK